MSHIHGNDQIAGLYMKSQEALVALNFPGGQATQAAKAFPYFPGGQATRSMPAALTSAGAVRRAAKAVRDSVALIATRGRGVAKKCVLFVLGIAFVPLTGAACTRRSRH